MFDTISQQWCSNDPGLFIPLVYAAHPPSGGRRCVQHNCDHGAPYHPRGDLPGGSSRAKCRWWCAGVFGSIKGRSNMTSSTKNIGIGYGWLRWFGQNKHHFMKSNVVIMPFIFMRCFLDICLILRHIYICKWHEFSEKGTFLSLQHNSTSQAIPQTIGPFYDCQHPPIHLFVRHLVGVVEGKSQISKVYSVYLLI